VPYTIESLCPACTAVDSFRIGLWPVDAGICLCPTCKRMVNVSLESGRCAVCQFEPSQHDFYDYARSIPYFGGASIGPIESGPTCLKCSAGDLTFTNTAHTNYGILGRTEDGARPWWGRDTLEKAIFVISLFAFAREHELDMGELLAYYNLDVPRPLMPGRRVSFPIYRDISAHIYSRVRTGEARITVSSKLHAALAIQ
jgi:hypothetical protein